MTKKYNTPMLQVVSISKKDIIATSDLGLYNDATLGAGDILAPDRFSVFGDSWANAGY